MCPLHDYNFDNVTASCSEGIPVRNFLQEQVMNVEQLMWNSVESWEEKSLVTHQCKASAFILGLILGESQTSSSSLAILDHFLWLCKYASLPWQPESEVRPKETDTIRVAGSGQEAPADPEILVRFEKDGVKPSLRDFPSKFSF